MEDKVLIYTPTSEKEYLEKIKQVLDVTYNRIELEAALLDLFKSNNELTKAKHWMRQNWKEHDITCVACNQRVHLYRRRLNSGMASFLYGLFKMSGGDTEVGYHYQEVMKFIGFFPGDYANLVHWGLITQSEQDGAGFYRITKLALLFIAGEVNVAAKIHLYNAKYEGRSPEDVSFQEAIGKRFELIQLMNDKSFFSGKKVY